MSSRPPNDAERGPVLRRSDQLAVAVLVAVGLASLGGYWVHRAIIGSRLIDIDRAAPLEARFQVDVNAAAWPELVQLPGVGEVLARRIVDERSQGGAFADHEDLARRVRGIGPRTLEGMRPYLLPMPEAGSVAGEGESSGRRATRGG